jgi:hypothetical protein
MNHVIRSTAVALLSLATLSVAIAADDPLLGTWVLNAAKSKAPIGAVPSAATVTVTAAGQGRYKSVSETTIGGARMRGEITFGMDGKDYIASVTPTPPGTATVVQSFERLDARGYRTTVKMNGQPIATTVSEVSPDGRTLTQTTTGIAARTGAAAVTVFDRRDSVASADRPDVLRNR